MLMMTAAAAAAAVAAAAASTTTPISLHYLHNFMIFSPMIRDNLYGGYMMIHSGHLQEAKLFEQRP